MSFAAEATTRTPAPLPPRPRIRLPIRPVDAPEALMLVSFEGLSEAEQRAALAAFPGGRRFLLAR